MLQTITRAARAAGRSAMLVAALAAAAHAAPTPAHPAHPADEGGARPAAVDAGEAALSSAAAERKAAYALEGDARESALLAAAAAFGRVADDAALPAGQRAEGAFRAGELLRARGRGDEAGTRFGQAVALGLTLTEGRGQGRSFGARGQLELAHALRRGQALEETLAAYASVGHLFPEQAHAVAQALGWRARLLVKAGRPADAASEADSLERLSALDAMEAVHLAGSIASALVDVGEEDRARAVVSVLDRHIAPFLAGETSQANKLREARDELRVTLMLTGT